MTTFRSLQTIEAVQYEGASIPEVTCSGDGDDQKRYGCTGLAGVPHVHTAGVGGAHRLEVGDWIFPATKGGPFDVASDGKFRAYWEVPVPQPSDIQGNATINALFAGMGIAPIESFPQEQSSQSTGEGKEESAEADQSAAGAEVSEQPVAGETPLPVDQIIFSEPVPEDGPKLRPFEVE